MISPPRTWPIADGARWRCVIKRQLPGSGWWFAAALALVLGGAVGCDDEQKYVLNFSHKNHVEEYEVACADCHGEVTGGAFASPGHAACFDCHEDWMDTDKVSEKTCGECHKERDLKELSALEAPESTAVEAGVFVHTAALSNRCADCHGGVLTEESFRVPEMKRGDRRRIREAAHQWGLDCTACHENMDPTTPPPSHDLNWERRHGGYSVENKNLCGLCHAEQSCRECHQETMPTSHNNLWRLKTHGMEAAWDRARCQVCHEEDSCTACHADTRPQSHNANWEKTHCLQCHPSDATGTGCSFCHEGGLDAHPDPHPMNWESAHCRNCHAGSPEAEQCKICHEGAGLDTHPNPHSAGFERNHCGSCHNGISGVSCAACHGGDLLEDHPNPHSSSFERNHCSSCHNGINGVSCSECHGGDILDEHPNPHSAGFENNHCDSCHNGLNGVSCETCHGADLIDGHPNPHPGSFKQTHCNSCHAGSGAQECELCHEGGSSVLVHEDFWPDVHNRFGDQVPCSTCHF